MKTDGYSKMPGRRFGQPLVLWSVNRMAEKRYEMDMCSGPLLSKILAFTLPLILSSVLQLLFNAADVIVVGRYAGSTALAAVGSTGPLINLIVNLFMGLSVGVSVTVARHYGAREYTDVAHAVHTSVFMSLLGGVAVGAFGFLMAKPLLTLMGSPADVIDQAALYVRIYFIGMPASMLYNFGSAILRAVGDTKRPLYYLSAAGVLNVLLNLLFVIRFSMGVAGVALATILSQYVSAALILTCLMRSESCYQLHLGALSFHKAEVRSIIRIGLPAGLQSSLFAISNVVVQSSINSFGSVAMAGSAAAANIEGFVYVSMNSVAQASLSFTSQNIGARQYERIGKICRTCLLLAALLGLLLGNGAYLLRDVLLGLYSPDPAVIEAGAARLLVIGSTYFLCGMMDTLACMLRAMGRSLLPMVVTIIGACGLRILWIYTVFPLDRTFFTLFLSYPITWGVTGTVHAVCYLVTKKQLLRRAREEGALDPADVNAS